jgi:hypothetical protein
LRTFKTGFFMQKRFHIVNMMSTANLSSNVIFHVNLTVPDICRRGGTGRRAGLKIQ